MTWNQKPKVTIMQLKKLCRDKGINLEYDGDSQCYRATCQQGMCYEPGLHELIGVFGGGIIGNGQTKAEAREDLYERLLDETPEPCTIKECDWCNQ